MEMTWPRYGMAIRLKEAGGCPCNADREEVAEYDGFTLVSVISGVQFSLDTVPVDGPVGITRSSGVATA